MSAQTIVTNQEFADRIGCHHSMASRLLNGQRFPGLELMEKIGVEYNIEWDELLEARKGGVESFGELLRSRVMPAPPSTVGQ